MMRSSPLVILLCLLPSLLQAGTVRTLDGKTLEGEIRLEENAIFVTPPKGNATRVPVENILRATWAPGSQIASGIILADGSAFACDRFFSADNISVKFFRGGKEQALPVDQVSRLIFSTAGHAPTPSGALGVILANKDFFEGEFQALLPNGRVRVSSVLFGLRELAVKTEVAAVVFRPAGRLAETNVVRLKDGTEQSAQALSIKRAGVQVDDRLIDPKDLSEIRFGAAAQSLVDLAPTDMPGLLIDATPIGIPPALFGLSGDRAMSLSAGARATFALNGAYRSLNINVGVPLTMNPAMKAGVIVLADEKEVARVAGRSSIDDPAVLSVNVAGVSTLVIQSTSETQSLPGFVVLVDPLLVKASTTKD